MTLSFFSAFFDHRSTQINHDDDDDTAQRLNFKEVHGSETLYNKCDPFFPVPSCRFQQTSQEESTNLFDVLCWNNFVQAAFWDSTEIFPREVGLKFVLDDGFVMYVPMLAITSANFTTLCQNWTNHRTVHPHQLHYTMTNSISMKHYCTFYVDYCNEHAQLLPIIKRLCSMSSKSEPVILPDQASLSVAGEKMRELMANPKLIASCAYYQSMDRIVTEEKKCPMAPIKRKKEQPMEMEVELEPCKLQFYNASDSETIYEKCAPLFLEQTMVYCNQFTAEQGHNLQELLLWNIFNRMARMDANSKYRKARHLVDIYPRLAGLKFVCEDKSICYVPILSMKKLNFLALSTTWQNAMARKHVLEDYSSGDFQNLLHHSMLYVDVCECSFPDELERAREMSMHSKPADNNHSGSRVSPRQHIRWLLANPKALSSVAYYQVMAHQ